ncbi:MAG: hypothetical protein NC342_06295 [Pseudoflavonifractor sp.]|nr:hypothetical protein [Alloprevotella sp.]MCM1117128.1 hypothetical protein [Pseudoflavonifractor sp.]
MARLFSSLIAPLLPAIIPLIILAACATSPGHDAAQACEAAEKGDIPAAMEAANKAFTHYEQLSTSDLCRLAAAYAVITITSGDEQAADRFQTVYKASLTSDPQEADSFYRTLDPQMADGLAIISGLLDGQGIYTGVPTDTATITRPSSEPLTDIPQEGLAED